MHRLHLLLPVSRQRYHGKARHHIEQGGAGSAGPIDERRSHDGPIQRQRLQKVVGGFFALEVVAGASFGAERGDLDEARHACCDSRGEQCARPLIVNARERLIPMLADDADGIHHRIRTLQFFRKRIDVHPCGVIHRDTPTVTAARGDANVVTAMMQCLCKFSTNKSRAPCDDDLHATSREPARPIRVTSPTVDVEDAGSTSACRNNGFHIELQTSLAACIVLRQLRERYFRARACDARAHRRRICRRSTERAEPMARG